VADEGSRLQDGGDAVIISSTCTTTAVKTAHYCPVNDVPLEYCEWLPKAQYEESKKSFMDSWKDLYPEVDEDGLTALLDRLGFGELDEAAKRAQKAKSKEPVDEQAAEQSRLAKEKKASKIKKTVTIELTTRNKKKHITCVRGLGAFEVDESAAAKLFGKKFASGSAFQKGKNGQPDEIVIQGNCIEDLPSFISEKFKHITEADMTLIGEPPAKKG